MRASQNCGLLKGAFQYEIYRFDRDMSGAFNKGRDYLSSLSYGLSRDPGLRNPPICGSCVFWGMGVRLWCPGFAGCGLRIPDSHLAFHLHLKIAVSSSKLSSTPNPKPNNPCVIL